MIIAIAASESSLDYSVKHPDSITRGIGGIKTIHKTKAKLNSLMAIEEVWENYLTISNGDKRKALKLYKGTKRNFKSFNRTWALYTKAKKVIKAH